MEGVSSDGKLSSSTPEENAAQGFCILVFAPTGNDAQVTSRFLQEVGLSVIVCRSMSEVAGNANSSGIILLAEETLNAHSVGILSDMISQQPSWSDIPIIIITSSGEASKEKLNRLSSLGSQGNVGLLERPFRRGTLISTVEVAIRARERQFQVRDLLAERKNAEAQLEQTVAERTAQLTETNDQLETLVYSIAHDLRAPLRSMQAFAKILVEDYAPVLDDEGKHYAGRIARSAETMDMLVLDLLAYGKLSRAAIPLETVSIGNAWLTAVGQFEQEILERKAVIKTASPLPTVQANEASLIQMLANLLGNALKFTPLDRTPQIEFWAEERESTVRLSVHDNGVGVPPEYHERIFRVFERLEKDDKGTGIGLSIVRKGAERMGGTAGVESGTPRVGSLFWIELPNAQHTL